MGGELPPELSTAKYGAGLPKSSVRGVGNRLVRFDATQTHNLPLHSVVRAREGRSQAEALHTSLVAS